MNGSEINWGKGSGYRPLGLLRQRHAGDERVRPFSHSLTGGKQYEQ
ncbi:hypothetical protein SELSPUOL_02183 [Selenomonas sputigena ATCC 35185]|uniref:Uncharacterized protein n=1 Tax=Selenomonas sputigena (strain ATCC 35185 / DSM 20758 / CCUG 44933 / VPI D19B-28) TaxID=546271 RepID=C9LXH5_SELS3|nr:hypothetical protein SELSPUOL_02183 [Selenomonas sputigena ATCC 35185]